MTLLLFLLYRAQTHFKVLIAEMHQLAAAAVCASSQMGGRGIPLKVLFLQVV